jgi:hypothetical protein
VALVCKRWQEVLDSPLLLRRVAVRAGACSDAGLAGLLRWLHRTAAPHVRQLELQLESLRRPDGALAAPGLTGQLASALAACGAAGRLRSLSLRVHSPLSLSSAELAPLRSLHSLCLEACPGQGDDGGCSVLLHLAALHELSSLLELRLGGGRVSLCGALPPSLTRLALDGFHDAAAAGAPLHCLPSQVGMPGAAAGAWLPALACRRAQLEWTV